MARRPADTSLLLYASARRLTGPGVDSGAVQLQRYEGGQAGRAARQGPRGSPCPATCMRSQTGLWGLVGSPGGVPSSWMVSRSSLAPTCKSTRKETTDLLTWCREAQPRAQCPQRAWAWTVSCSTGKPELHWLQDAAHSETWVTVASMYAASANSTTFPNKSSLKPVLCCLAEGTGFPAFPAGTAPHVP